MQAPTAPPPVSMIGIWNRTHDRYAEPLVCNLKYLHAYPRQQGQVPRDRRQPEVEAERHRVDRRRRQGRQRQRRQEVGARLHHSRRLRRGIRSGKTKLKDLIRYSFCAIHTISVRVLSW